MPSKPESRPLPKGQTDASTVLRESLVSFSPAGVGATRWQERWRGLIQGGMGLVASALFLAFDRPAMALLAGSLGVVITAAAALWPAGLQRCLRTLAQGVGTLLAGVLLAPVYLLFFVPFGLLFRSGHHDRLERHLDRNARSYWRRRKPREAGPAPFERQF